MDAVDRVAEMLDAGGFLTVGQLERAFDELNRGAHPGPASAAVARLRIAVRLEQLERRGRTAPAVA